MGRIEDIPGKGTAGAKVGAALALRGTEQTRLAEAWHELGVIKNAPDHWGWGQNLEALKSTQKTLESVMAIGGQASAQAGQCDILNRSCVLENQLNSRQTSLGRKASKDTVGNNEV